MVFMKDILKYSNDKDEHTVYLRTVLQTLKEHQLHSKYKKCERWLEALVFLEHMVSKEEIKVHLQKGESSYKVSNFHQCTEIRNCLSLAGNYQV